MCLPRSCVANACISDHLFSARPRDYPHQCIDRSHQCEHVEEIEIEAIDRKKKKKKEKEPQIVKAKLNFVLTTYYKGTGMEEVLKKLEQYLDNADKRENDITCI